MNIETVNKSLDYIEKHLHNKLTTEMVSEYVLYSHYHFTRMFSEAIGLSVKQYINRRKVMYVLYKTRNGESLITSAFDYGFDDYSSFYKACKKVYGMSPKACLEKLTHNKPKVFFIGREKYPMITEQKLKTLIRKWSLKDYSIKPVYTENRQQRKDQFLVDDYIVIITNNYNKIIESKRIADALNHDGIRTPNYIKNTKGDYYEQVDDQYIVVKEHFKDKTFSIDEIKSSKETRILLGEALGKLHITLQALEPIEEVTSTYHTCKNWAIDIVKTLEVEKKLDTEFYEEYHKFEALSKKLPYSIIHRNPHLHNIFFDGDEVVGYGDFYLTTQNMRLFDICYLCTSILAEANMEKATWLHQYKDLIEGYNNMIPLSEDEINAVPYMIYSIQMIFIAYFATQDAHQDLAIKNYELLRWLYENLA